MKSERIPFIVIFPLYLIFISLFVFQVHNFSNLQKSPVSLSNIHKLLSIGIALFLLAYFYIKYHRIRKIIFPLWIYLFYLVIGIISSIILSPNKGYSIYKVLEVFTDFLFVIYIWTLSYKWKFILEYTYELIIKYYKFLILITLLGIVIFPSESLRPPTAYGHALLPIQLFGSIIQINADGLGMISAILFVISYIRYFIFKKKKKSDFIWFIISLIVLILSQSRTSVLAVGVMLLFFILINKRINFIFKILIILFIFIAIFYLKDFILAYLSRGLNETQIQNLSGRKIWWLFAINEFIHWDFLKQLFGTGFMVGSRLILVKLGQGNASSLHSDYMDVLMSSGIMGEFFFILFIVSSFILFIKNFKYLFFDNYLLEAFSIIILLDIRTLTGPTLASQSFFILLYLLLLVLSYNRINNLKKVLNEQKN